MPSEQEVPYESLADRGLTFEEVPCTDRSPDLELPFEVELFGASLTDVEVDRRGQLSVTANRFTSAPTVGGIIAPFSGPLEGLSDDCPRVRHATTGQAPNRVFHVELSDFNWRDSDAIRVQGGAFQVQFFEGDARFEVHYGGDVDWVGGSNAPTAFAFWEASGRPKGPEGHFAPCSLNTGCTDADFNDEFSGHRFRVTKAVEPELRPVFFEVDVGALPGQTARARITVENNGELAAEGVDLALYASVDAAVDPIADRRLILAEDLLVVDPLGTQLTVTLPFEVPADIAADRRLYVYAWVDPTNAYDELIEADNRWTSSVPNFSTGYDLEVTGCRVTAPPRDGSPGAPVEFEVDLASVGAPYRGDVEVALWAAEGPALDAGRDAALGRVTVALSSDHPQTTVTVEGALPASGLDVGSYFPACVADPRDVVAEIDGAELNRLVDTTGGRFYVAPAQLDIVPDDALPDARVATPYEYEVQVAGGGFAQEQVSFTAEGLPAGLEITPRGLIRGEAREVTSSEGRSFVVEATAGGDIDRERFTLRVLPPGPLVFAPAELPTATRGRDYEARLEATGGVGDPVFRLSGGVLPEGMELSGEGSLRGRPVELGAFEIEVSVTDSPPRGVATQELSRTFELEVVDESLTFDRSSIPPAEVGRRYDARIEARSTTPPLSWSFRAEPGVPAGMAMGPAPNGTLFWIRGVPESAGELEVEIEIEDASGRRGEQRFELVIEPAPEPEAGPAGYVPGGGCSSVSGSFPGALGALVLGLWVIGRNRRRGRSSHYSSQRV